MMENETIREAVHDIQDHISGNKFFIEYRETGVYESVYLIISVYSMDIEILIWDCETNDREYDEETGEVEDFKTYISRKVNDAIKLMTELEEVLNKESNE